MQDGRPLAWSYPFLDDVYGALPSAAEHTALKEAFFQPQRKSSTSSDLAPVQIPPAPTPAAEPQLLPALLPLAGLQVLHVAPLGQVGGGPLRLSSEDTCFPVGRGCVGVGRVEQNGWRGSVYGAGVGRGGLPPGREGNKRTGALSHALFIRK